MINYRIKRHELFFKVGEKLQLWKKKKISESCEKVFFLFTQHGDRSYQNISAGDSKGCAKNAFSIIRASFYRWMKCLRSKSNEIDPPYN